MGAACTHGAAPHLPVPVRVCPQETARGIASASGAPEPKDGAGATAGCVAEVYEFGESLGSGAFGTVALVRHRHTGAAAALKAISKCRSAMGRCRQLRPSLSQFRSMFGHIRLRSASSCLGWRKDDSFGAFIE